MNKASKLRSIAASLLIIGVAGMAANCSTLPGDTNTEFTASAQSPHLIQRKSIILSDLGPESYVERIIYSPDGRYIAIIDYAPYPKIDIVVWDLQLDREQAHIRGLLIRSSLSFTNLLWSHDGKFITFGTKQRWDPMTGEALPDIPVVGGSARMNKDGSKMLTIASNTHGSDSIHVYDTKDWTLQQVNLDGFLVKTAAWTGDDKIMVGVSPTRETLGKTIDGRTITHIEDVALRLLDPTGKTPTKAVWFPAIPDDRSGSKDWKQSSDVELFVTNFAANQIALSTNRIINGETMDILTYYPLDDINDKFPTGTGGRVFSPDGKYLYIKTGIRINRKKPTINAIIDTATGKQVEQFVGGDHGIAIKPDGRQLAMGDTKSVQILDIK